MAIPSRHATRIDVCLFEGDTETRRMALEKVGDLHVGEIQGLKAGDLYGLRAEGPWDPAKGHRFDVSKLLVDPWASQIERPHAFHSGLTERGLDTTTMVPKCVVTTPAKPIVRAKPHSPKWIYELPVRAFTMRHPDVPETLRGTVAALATEPVISHLKRIGVDTIELMPLAGWIDERHLHALGLRNAWGYNPVTFMAPEPRLAPGGFAEIAEAVKTLHAEGFQVVVDVVLNHTGESDIAGPTLSFRGLDHATWYAHAGGNLVNDTGCGNTLALHDPLVADYAVASLRHWIEATGIDGFRFDLATIMGRTPSGFDPHAQLLRRISSDPVLGDCILIAEPWDVGPGGYQLGQFPANWLEWNDRFRDDVRRFWRGDDYSANTVATRLAGSSDAFQPRKSPSRGVNFVAAHDGFTLADLTRFTRKNNLANGEGNRDGKSDEITAQGADPAALLASLFLSRGTPMLSAGDEFGRSQGGNNNAYAQDNDTTWLQWADADQGLADVVAKLVALRAAHPALSADHFLTGIADSFWFGVAGQGLDWSLPHNIFLCLQLSGTTKELAIVLNRSTESPDLALAAAEGFAWRRLFPAGSGISCPSGMVSLFVAERA